MTKRRFRLKQIHLFFILLFLLGIIHPMNMEAQTLSKKYPKETLASRMQQISKDYNINIGYRPEQCQFEITELVLTNANIDQALTKSLASTRFAYRKNANNTFVVYEKKEEEKKPATPQQKTSGKGSLSGTVVDERGESIPGVNVIVPQTTNGTITDLDGKYKLDNIPAGVTTIQFSFMSYQTLQVNDVKIAARETTPLDVVLKEASQELGEVVVTGSVKANTQAGLLAMQKISPVMSDGISAQQIAKAPDSDVAQALKRVTGITTVDNKYVVVRSMGERWNTAAMDGVNLPSSDGYSNNFSFDIIPTSMVEGVVISKTATPDMNASFAGGYVEIKTKDIPNENFITLSIGGGYNDISTGKDFLTRQRGKYDYWGYDDGTHDFPKDLEASDITTENFFEQSKRFTQDNFTTYKTKAKPNSNFQFSMGRSFALEGNDKWGFAGSLTFRNEQQKTDIDHTGRSSWLFNAFRSDDTTPTSFYNFKNSGANYSYSSVLAGMLNFGLQLGKHRLSFRNTYTHTADISLTQVTGWTEYSGSGNAGSAENAYQYFYNNIPPEDGILENLELPRKVQYNYPVYQQFMQNKLEGSHKLGGLDVKWFASRTAVAYDMKDFTSDFNYYKMQGNEIYHYYQIYNSSPGQYRKNIDSDSEDWNFGADASFRLDLNSFKNTIKAGYFGTLRENTNQQSSASLKVDPKNPDVWNNNILDFYSWEQLFSDYAYEAEGIGWSVSKRYGNRYHGKVTQHSPFLMFDNRLGSQWRLVWGARVEYYKYRMLESQRENAISEGFEETQTDDKLWQLLPSANFTYSPVSDINLRLAYSRSVMRPGFQERTAIPFYDPIASATVINASGVRSSVADNFDFKFEWFPAAGEILSFGLYHKKIDRPIERVGYTTAEGSLQLYVVNSKEAVLNGFEAEVKKNLGFIVQNSFFDNFFVSANFTYNITKVTGYVDRFGIDHSATYEADRPLYGQTPWAYNLGLSYDGERLGLNIVHNAKGDQYITVGYDYKDEEIQRPYQTTDAQLSYKLLKNKNLQIKLNAKNLFNTPIETYNNWNSYRTDNPNWSGVAQQVRERYILSPNATDKYDKDTDELMYRAFKGRTFSLSVNYTF